MKLLKHTDNLPQLNQSVVNLSKSLLFAYTILSNSLFVNLLIRAFPFHKASCLLPVLIVVPQATLSALDTGMSAAKPPVFRTVVTSLYFILSHFEGNVKFPLKLMVIVRLYIR